MLDLCSIFIGRERPTQVWNRLNHLGYVVLLMICEEKKFVLKKANNPTRDK